MTLRRRPETGAMIFPGTRVKESAMEGPIIGRDLAPDLAQVDFRRGNSVFDDLVVTEGDYANESGERFRITLAAPKESEAALKHYAAEMRVWAEVERDSSRAEL